MATELYGPVDTSRRLLVKAYTKGAGAAIVANDCLTRDANGFVSKAVAGGVIHGVAVQAATPGSGDGDVSLYMDVSEETPYRFPCDAAPSRALEGKTCDLNGSQEIDIAGGAVDNVRVHSVDTENSTAIVTFAIGSEYASVVP